MQAKFTPGRQKSQNRAPRPLSAPPRPAGGPASAAKGSGGLSGRAQKVLPNRKEMVKIYK